MKTIKIGIIGFGTVGSGTAKVLTENKDLIEARNSFSVSIKTVCVKDKKKTRSFLPKSSIISDNIEDILLDPEIDIVVEVMGGIEKSKKIIEEAFKRGKHVVTANKDLIAEYGSELTQLAQKNNLHFLYEAAVAGGIPILQTLQYSLAGNKIQKIAGIINGSTNYILTRTEIEKLSLETIIEDAKSLGYLEADPSADLDGLDAGRKCAILASIAFNSLVKFNQVYVAGIRKIELEDIEYANEMGYSIKLLAVAENRGDCIVARVHPALIEKNHPLASVKDSFNAVYLKDEFLGDAMFYGRGAGDLPTGSAVVNDILNISKAIIKDLKPEYAYKLFESKRILDIKDLEFQYYIRLKVKEDENILASLVNILSKHNIFVNLIKEGKIKEKYKDYILITSKSKQADLDLALEEINSIDKLVDRALIIRIERGL